jgi:hypothetical protein
MLIHLNNRKEIRRGDGMPGRPRRRSYWPRGLQPYPESGHAIKSNNGPIKAAVAKLPQSRRIS